jgi:hypothetical protein
VQKKRAKFSGNERLHALHKSLILLLMHPKEHLIGSGYKSPLRHPMVAALSWDSKPDRSGGGQARLNHYFRCKSHTSTIGGGAMLVRVTFGPGRSLIGGENTNGPSRAKP